MSIEYDANDISQASNRMYGNGIKPKKREWSIAIRWEKTSIASVLAVASHVVKGPRAFAYWLADHRSRHQQFESLHSQFWSVQPGGTGEDSGGVLEIWILSLARVAFQP